MRHPLGTPASAATRTVLPAVAVLALALTGCGEDDAPATRTDPPQQSTRPADDPTGDATTEPGDGEPRVVDLLSASNAGGTVATELTAVDSEAAVAEFVAPFGRSDLAADVRDAVAGVEDGVPMAAVVAVGCDVPPGVLVEQRDDGYAVTARKVPSPLPECLVPVTTVAVVAVP